MRKIYLMLLLAFFLRLPVMSQTVIWQEDFDILPSTWSLEGNWTFDQGDLIFYYYPIYENYDFSAISPEIQIPNYPSELSFSQFIDPYLTGVTNETSEVWVISGDEEVKIFGYELSNGAWGVMGGQAFNQPLNQFAGKTVRFKFRSWGASTNSLWGWTIYNIQVSATFNNDLTAIEVSGTSNLIPGTTGNWQFSFKNVGQQPQSNVLVKLFSYKTGEQIGQVNYTGTVNPDQTAVVNFPWTPGDYQNTSLYALIDAPNDEFPLNNRSKGFFVRVEPPVEARILLWDNDNDIPTIYNDETGLLEQANAGIEKALSQAGLFYTKVNNLPSELSNYNLVICTMGSYCLS